MNASTVGAVSMLRLSQTISLVTAVRPYREGERREIEEKAREGDSCRIFDRAINAKAKKGEVR